jgi:hypothetical protein
LHPALTPAARTLLREFENLHEKNFLTRFRAIRHMKLIRQNQLEEMMVIALIWAYGLRNDHLCPTEA